MKNKIAIFGVIAGAIGVSIILGVIYDYDFAYGCVVFLAFVGLMTLAVLTVGVLNNAKKTEPNKKGFGWNKELE